MKLALPLFLLIFAAACNREEKPEAPTPAETARLDEAEDMLNNMAANSDSDDNTINAN